MGRPVMLPDTGDSHALVIAVPVDIDTLDDPSARDRIVARAAALAREALTDLAVAETDDLQEITR
jgi:hypothetical protein